MLEVAPKYASRHLLVLERPPGGELTLLIRYVLIPYLLAHIAIAYLKL